MAYQSRWQWTDVSNSNVLEEKLDGQNGKGGRARRSKESAQEVSETAQTNKKQQHDEAADFGIAGRKRSRSKETENAECSTSFISSPQVDVQRKSSEEKWSDLKVISPSSVSQGAEEKIDKDLLETVLMIKKVSRQDKIKSIMDKYDERKIKEMLMSFDATTDNPAVRSNGSVDKRVRALKYYSLRPRSGLSPKSTATLNLERRRSYSPEKTSPSRKQIVKPQDSEYTDINASLAATPLGSTTRTPSPSAQNTTARDCSAGSVATRSKIETCPVPQKTCDGPVKESVRTSGKKLQGNYLRRANLTKHIEPSAGRKRMYLKHKEKKDEVEDDPKEPQGENTTETLERNKQTTVAAEETSDTDVSKSEAAADTSKETPKEASHININNDSTRSIQSSVKDLSKGKKQVTATGKAASKPDKATLKRKEPPANKFPIIPIHKTGSPYPVGGSSRMWIGTVCRGKIELEKSFEDAEEMLIAIPASKEVVSKLQKKIKQEAFVVTTGNATKEAGANIGEHHIVNVLAAKETDGKRVDTCGRPVTRYSDRGQTCSAGNSIERPSSPLNKTRLQPSDNMKSRVNKTSVTTKTSGTEIGSCFADDFEDRTNPKEKECSTRKDISITTYSEDETEETNRNKRVAKSKANEKGKEETGSAAQKALGGKTNIKESLKFSDDDDDDEDDDDDIKVIAAPKAPLISRSGDERHICVANAVAKPKGILRTTEDDSCKVVSKTSNPRTDVKKSPSSSLGSESETRSHSTERSECGRCCESTMTMTSHICGRNREKFKHGKKEDKTERKGSEDMSE